jgi:DNA-binding NarL/FixJ family response regulator
MEELVPAKRKNSITILIADDHPSTRGGLRSILEKIPDMKVVGEAEDGEQIKKLIADLRPSILLLDLKMPHLSPAELEKWVRENYPETTTLVLTGHDRDSYLSDMMEAGAAGYLDKKLRAGQLISSIRRAANGEILFDSEQIERARRWREEVRNKWEGLSDREREVLQLLTEGADNPAIASSLKVTISTAEKHLTNIYKKLGVTSRTEAILWWLQQGGDFRN